MIGSIEIMRSSISNVIGRRWSCDGLERLNPSSNLFTMKCLVVSSNSSDLHLKLMAEMYERAVEAE